MINTTRCQKCHGTKNLCKNSKRIKKDGSEVIQYLCRKCNTDRIKEYMKNPNNRKTVYKSVYASIERNMDKQLARIKLNYQIKKGNIKRPKKCTICKKYKKIEGHHKDYTKPLEVIWTCRQCHADLHKTGKHV